VPAKYGVHAEPIGARVRNVDIDRYGGSEGREGVVVHSNPDIVTEVRRPDDVHFPTAANWVYSGIALSPDRLRAASRDRRCQTSWVVARRGESIIGVTALYQPKAAAIPDAIYDPRTLAPALAATSPETASELLYVGGYRELISGTTVAAEAASHERDRIRRMLIREAYAEGRRRGAYPVSLYVRDGEVGAFRRALGDAAAMAAISGNAVLPLDRPTADAYLASLSANARRRVRREWQQIEAYGRTSRDGPAADLFVEAAALVADAKRRHGVQDHPLLVQRRLREWAMDREADFRAFSVRSNDGALLGVSFAARYGQLVEVYEVALVAETEHRHLMYVELLVYAPLRFAWRHGCREVVLGLDSATPKAQRGARIDPVWAVFARTRFADGDLTEPE
jgi:hypothetical protein